MRLGIGLLGVVCLAFAASLEAGRRYLSPFIAQKIHAGILEQVVWSPDSPPIVKDRFIGSDADAPDYIRFYLLNITNLADVRAGESKPILEELGPYTFIKYHRKVNVSFSPDNTTVTFNEFFSFHPVPHLTNGSLDDPITTLNIALLGAIEGVFARTPARFAPWLQYLARVVDGWKDPRVQGLFTTRSVQELLFGYEDPLLSRLSHFLPGINPTVALVPNMTATQETEPNLDQQDVAYTGADGVDKVAQFLQWRGMREVTAWRPPHIEVVQGTDAMQFRPGLRRGDEIKVWVGDVFRWFTLIEGFGPGAESAKVGFVPVLRFRPDPTQREPDPRYYQSVPGLMNITAPMAAQSGGVGPPLFLSLPGYCYADDVLVRGVEGISCDPLKHDIHLDIEPTTGITLSALKTLMLNSWFGERYHAVEPHVQDTFLPIFWASETSEASSQQLAGFRTLLVVKAAQRFFQTAAGPMAIGVGLLGLIVLVAGVVMGGTRTNSAAWEEDRTAGGDDEEAAPDGGGGGGAAGRRPLLFAGNRDDILVASGGGGGNISSRAIDIDEILAGEAEIEEKA